MFIKLLGLQWICPLLYIYFTCLCLAPGHSEYNWHNIIFMYWSVELYAPTMHMRWENPSVLYIIYNYNIICTHVTSIIPKCDPIIRLRYSKCHTFIFWRFRDMVCKNMQLIFSFKKMHCSPTYHKWPKCRLSISDKWGTHFSDYNNLIYNCHTIEWNTSLESLCFYLYTDLYISIFNKTKMNDILIILILYVYRNVCM